MSNRQALIAKIKEHKEQLDRARQEKENQHLRFSASITPLYAQLQRMLTGIDGIITSIQEPVMFIDGTDKPSFHIEMLGKEIQFLPIEDNGVPRLKVVGLYDRELYFRPLSDETWEADDERSDNVIHLSEDIIFKRLVALVPSKPATS